MIDPGHMCELSKAEMIFPGPQEKISVIAFLLQDIADASQRGVGIFGIKEWLVQEGIKRELGEMLLQIKCPTFFFSDSPETIAQAKVSFDFALAQSIFSHCGLDLIQAWLSAISRSLAQDGVLGATFLIGEEDSAQTGWIYPDCVNYRPTTLERAAGDVNLRFEILDWKHPRQTWALFAAPGFNSTWFKERPLTWNSGLDRALSQKHQP